MTMISFACKGDHAEIVTDSLSYTPGLRTLGQTSKTLPIPHMDAAVITQGDSEFGNNATVTAMHLSDELTTFDELTTTAPEWLPLVWEKAEDLDRRSDSIVFLIGYSTKRRKFESWAFTSEDGFAAQRISGAFVTPSPWNLRPHKIEYERALRAVGQERLDKALPNWRGKKPLPTPRSIAEWAYLAEQVREQRATGSRFCHVGVGGRVFYTRLARGGSVLTDVIYEYDDSGEEFQKLVAGSMHPQGQLGPCPCDSGKSYLECCLAWYIDEPCECKSGETFRDCCMVTANADEPATVGS